MTSSDLLSVPREIVARVTLVELPDAGFVPVAVPEELLAMKRLSMSALCFACSQSGVGARLQNVTDLLSIAH